MSPSSERQQITAPDAASLRAMAHPARMAALAHLMKVGPATATDLAEVAGLTPSAMSYHLRTLDRAGLIEAAESRGDGRERLWRSVHTGYEIEMFEDGTLETRRASRRLLESILALQDVEVRRWLARSDEPGWLDSGFFTESTLLVTAEEMREIGNRVAELLKPYRPSERADPPAGAVSTRHVLRMFPYDDTLRKDI